MSESLNIDLMLGDDLPSNMLSDLPNEATITQWLNTAYSYVTQALPANNQAKPVSHGFSPEISIRIVSSQESQFLNAQYRNKNKPTNVLSFESELPDFVPSGLLGDLAICAQVVADEAKEQNKAIDAHWAHICIHGLLHLMGFDHIDETDAKEMEDIEIFVLAKLGIDDPYQIS